MSLDLARFHKTFFEESFENLETMEQALLCLDVAAVDAEVINTIFRAAHSIKGGAATFGFAAVASFTHHAETLLDQMRSGARPLAQADVDLLLRAGDCMRNLLVAAREGADADVRQVAEVQSELERTLSITSPGAAPAVGAPTAIPAGNGWRIRFAPPADLFASGNDPVRILRAVADGAEALHQSQRLVQCRLHVLHHFTEGIIQLLWQFQLRNDRWRTRLLRTSSCRQGTKNQGRQKISHHTLRKNSEPKVSMCRLECKDSAQENT